MAEASEQPKRGRGRPRKMVPMPKDRGGRPNGGSSSSSLSPEKIRGRIDPETVIEFLQSLKIPEGPKAGEPLVLAEYQKAEDVTRRRLYIETMEKVLGQIDKTILDSALVGGEGQQGVVPYLPLNELRRPAPAAAQGN